MPPPIIREAQLRDTGDGLVPDGDGWFVVNAREARWRDGGPLGRVCFFESGSEFTRLGINVSVLDPGQPMAMYHYENEQEAWGAYTVDPAAIRHGAGVESETTSPAEAYARFPDGRFTRYREGWLPG